MVFFRNSNQKRAKKTDEDWNTKISMKRDNVGIGCRLVLPNWLLVTLKLPKRRLPIQKSTTIFQIIVCWRKIKWINNVQEQAQINFFLFQTSQLFKIGSHSYEAMKQFTVCIEEALFKLPVHRDRALTYKMEEVQITTVDEIYVEQNETGSILKQIARVRLFFLGFLSGMLYGDIFFTVDEMNFL